MKKLIFTTCCFLISTFLLNAQSIDFNDYKPLESSGRLPSRFETTWKQKVDLINDSTSKKVNRKAKKNNEDFVLDATYSMDGFFSSGKILFNTPLNTYVNKVMQGILQSNNISDDITVYIVKSTDVNAYAVAQNVIFVNIGLLARLNSEAELAFVLCHEYIHYRNKHSLNTYTKNKEISKDYKSYKKVDEDEILLHEARYSRELETEADAEGLKLFLNTGYSLKAPPAILDALKFSYLPLDSIPFPKSYFETEYLIFPDDYFLKELSPVKVKEEKQDDDETNFHSHPGISERKNKIYKATENLTDRSGVDFIISEADFNQVKNVARFELLRMELIDREYELALYNAFIIEKDFPTSIYVKKTILKALYNLASYGNQGKRSEVIKTYKKKEGSFQQVVHLFYKSTKKEVSYMALHYAWKLYKIYPDDIEITAITNDIFYQTGKYHKMKLDFFSTEKKPEAVIDTAKNSKPKKEEFIQYGFGDYLKDEAFVQMVNGSTLKKGQTTVNVKDESDEKEPSDKLKKNMEKTVSSSDKIDKILLFEPTSVKLDTRKNKKRKYLASEKSKTRLKSNLVLASTKNDIQLQFIDRSEIGVNDVQKINDIAFVSDFLSERVEHEDMKILPTDQLKMDEVCNRYGVKYIGLAGEIRFLEKPNFWNILLVFTPAIPYAIYKLASPKTNTIFFMAVYNMETHSVGYSTANLVANANNQDAVLGNWYYLFKTINEK